jgi:hypothetical protein
MQDSSVRDGDSTPSSLSKVLDYLDSDDHVRYDRKVNERMEGGFHVTRSFYWPLWNTAAGT